MSFDGYNVSFVGYKVSFVGYNVSFVGHNMSFHTAATNAVNCTPPPLIYLSFLKDKSIVTFNVKLS